MSDFETILPPNASPELRAIEQAMAETKAAIHAPITALWDVSACPVDVLPWLAWGLSVDVWDAGWSEETKRRVIAQSVELHRIKGTRGAVQLALAALGFRIDIIEGWEEGGAPHTFRLEAYGKDVFQAGFQIDARLFETVKQLIENVKPVRSHFTFRIGETFENDLHIAAGSRARYADRVEFAPASATASRRADATLRTGLRVTRIDRHEHRPIGRRAAVMAALKARSGLRVRRISRIDHIFQPQEGAAYAV